MFQFPTSLCYHLPHIHSHGGVSLLRATDERLPRRHAAVDLCADVIPSPYSGLAIGITTTREQYDRREAAPVGWKAARLGVNLPTCEANPRSEVPGEILRGTQGFGSDRSDSA
jgi:hypothetical protein